MNLFERFLQTTNHSPRQALSLWNEIEQRYSEQARRYHTLEHLDECFSLLDSCNIVPESRLEVELSLWYHDLIYKISSDASIMPPDNNEQLSAQRAYAVCTQTLRLADDVSMRIKKIIEGTKTHNNPHSTDCELVFDIDMAIIGAQRDRFLKYESQIREEFGVYPEEIYKQGRVNMFVRPLLASNRIFFTDEFHERFNEQARENLKYLEEQLQ